MYFSILGLLLDKGQIIYIETWDTYLLENYEFNNDAPIAHCIAAIHFVFSSWLFFSWRF